MRVFKILTVEATRFRTMYSAIRTMYLQITGFAFKNSILYLLNFTMLTMLLLLLPFHLLLGSATTITNCGLTYEYNRVPSRTVTLNQGATEVKFCRHTCKFDALSHIFDVSQMIQWASSLVWLVSWQQLNSKRKGALAFYLQHARHLQAKHCFLRVHHHYAGDAGFGS
jgi:hypothetical protein